MTYTELRQAIQTTAENNGDEFLQQIDTFILQAENLIYQSVRLPKFTTSATLSILANTPTVTAPDDFLAADVIMPAGIPPIYKKDISFLQEVYPAGAVGTPRFFAMFDDLTITIAPTPDQNYSALMTYFSKPVSIIGTQDEPTYVSDRFPTALLNGSLMFAAIFMKDPDMKAIHQEMFVNSLGLAGKFVNQTLAKQQFEKTNSAVSTGDQQ